MPSSYLLLYILPVKNIYITVTTSAFLFIFVAIRKKPTPSLLYTYNTVYKSKSRYFTHIFTTLFSQQRL